MICHAAHMGAHEVRFFWLHTIIGIDFESSIFEASCSGDVFEKMNQYVVDDGDDEIAGGKWGLAPRAHNLFVWQKCFKREIKTE